MDMDEMINRLTENGDYANDICLLLLVNNEDYFLKYLDKYNIAGRKLEKFFYDCCNNGDSHMLRTVFLCMDWNLFDKELVHENLEREHPIPFIDELYLPNEGFVSRYARYRDTFKANMSKNRTR